MKAVPGCRCAPCRLTRKRLECIELRLRARVREERLRPWSSIPEHRHRQQVRYDRQRHRLTAVRFLVSLVALLLIGCGGSVTPDPAGSWSVAGSGPCGAIAFSLDVDAYDSARSAGAAGVCPISVGVVDSRLTQHTYCEGREQRIDLDLASGTGFALVGRCAYSLTANPREFSCRVDCVRFHGAPGVLCLVIDSPEDDADASFWAKVESVDRSHPCPALPEDHALVGNNL